MKIPENVRQDLAIMLRSNDYGFSALKPAEKRVVLCDVEACKNISFWDLMTAFSGTGHSEWEAILSVWFLALVDDAVEKGENETDITKMFQHDFFASGGKEFTRQQIFDHVSRHFEMVLETGEELRVKWKFRTDPFA